MAESISGASDGEYVARARQEARVIFTMDDDFLRLHAESIDHAGIVYAAQGLSIGDIVHGLMLIRQTLTPAEMSGHVEFL